MIDRRLSMISFAAIAASLLGAACGDNIDGANPPRLWLGLAGSEVEVQLVPVEPEPY